MGRRYHIEYGVLLQPVGVELDGHISAAVQGGHIHRGKHRGAGAVGDFIGVEGIDLHIRHPPAGLCLFPAPLEPACIGGVHFVMIPGFVIQRLPGVSPVGAAVQVLAPVLPEAQGGYHNGIRVLCVDGYPAVAAVVTVSYLGGNVLIALVRKAEAVYLSALAGGVGAAGIAVAQIQIAVGGNPCLGGVHALFVGGKRLPAFSLVGGGIDALAVLHGHAHIDIVGNRVKLHPEDAHADALLAVIALYREGFYLFPVFPVILAPPQTVAPGAKVNGAVVLRVHHHPLSGASAGVICPEGNPNVHLLPVVPVIIGAENGAGLPHIGAAGHIHPVGLHRVGGKSLHSVEIPAVGVHAPQVVGDAHPFSVPGLPAVGASHIRPGVHEPLLGGVVGDAGDIAAAADGHIAPVVADGLHTLLLLVTGAEPCQHGKCHTQGCRPFFLLHASSSVLYCSVFSK